MTLTHRRVTIHDVARAADVSVSTVSKVVNERDGIAPRTRARVRAEIDRLGYATAVGARGLRAQRTGVLGVLVSEFEPYSTEVLKGIAEECAGSGFELLAWSGGTGGGCAPAGWERHLLARLAGSLVDGAVLVTPSVTSADMEGFPLVAVDPHDGSGPLPCVHADDYGGSRRAVAYLIGLGHRRIGFLGGRTDLESARWRERGYRDALADAGLAADEGLVTRGDYSRAGADAPARALLALAEPPTAIFAANDVSALRVLQLAAAAGLSVPADLSIVGFDNIPEAALSRPALTTVAQPMQTIGREAMRLLLGQLRGEPAAATRVRVPTELVVRETTAPPRVRTAAVGDGPAPPRPRKEADARL